MFYNIQSNNVNLPNLYLLKFCGILHNLKVVYQLLCSKFMAIHPFGGLV